MRYGIINCDCGQEFYFETNAKEIRCIQCYEKFDVSSYPVKAPETIEESAEGN